MKSSHNAFWGHNCVYPLAEVKASNFFQLKLHFALADTIIAHMFYFVNPVFEIFLNLFFAGDHRVLFHYPTPFRVGFNRSFSGAFAKTSLLRNAPLRVIGYILPHGGKIYIRRIVGEGSPLPPFRVGLNCSFSGGETPPLRVIGYILPHGGKIYNQ